nr:protein ydcX [Salmonella sp. NCTC 7297]
MSLYQKMLVFYAVMAVISFLITWFLTHDKKRIRFLSAFLVGATWPISFPRGIAVFAFLTSSPIKVTGHGFSARSGYQGN